MSGLFKFRRNQHRPDPTEAVRVVPHLSVFASLAGIAITSVGGYLGIRQYEFGGGAIQADDWALWAAFAVNCSLALGCLAWLATTLSKGYSLTVRCERFKSVVTITDGESFTISPLVGLGNATLDITLQSMPVQGSMKSFRLGKVPGAKAFIIDLFSLPASQQPEPLVSKRVAEPRGWDSEMGMGRAEVLLPVPDGYKEYELRITFLGEGGSSKEGPELALRCDVHVGMSIALRHRSAYGLVKPSIRNADVVVNKRTV